MKKLVKLFLFIFLISSFSVANAEMSKVDELTLAAEEVPDFSFIIGTQLFTDSLDAQLSGVSGGEVTTITPEYTDYYSGIIDLKTYMYAASTIESGNFTKVIAYYYMGFGEWIDALTYDYVEGEESYNITHINGVCVLNNNCPSVTSGGNTGTGNLVSYGFYYIDDSGKEQKILNTLPEVGTYLNVSMIPTDSIPNKKGYIIDGWREKDSDTKFDFSSKVAEAKKLYVRYIPLNYNIKYDLNGGNVAGATDLPVDSVLCQAGDNFNDNCITPDITPTKDGYAFKGWSIEKDDSTSQFVGNNESVIDLIASDENNDTNVTLYAVWEPVNYNITYYLNGGTAMAGTLVGYHNIVSPVDLTTSEVTRYGYTFDGWYDDTTQNANKVESISNRYTAISLYAKWIPVTKTIKYYNEDGTTLISSKSCVFDDCSVTEINPTKDGYEFLYWEGSDGNIYLKGDLVKTIVDLDLTARFNDGDYFDLTYDLNGGNNIGTSSISKYRFVGNSTEVDLPVPEKVGYTFTNWQIVTSSSTGIGTISNNKITVTRSGDITLKAIFTENHYNVSYEYYHLNSLTTETIDCTYTSCTAPSINEVYNGLSIKYWMGSDSKQYAANAVIALPVDGMILRAVYGNEESNSIKFYSDDVQLVNGYINKYSSDFAFNLPTPVKNGYKFLGWKTRGQTTDTPNFGTYLGIGQNGNLELEAIWSPIKVKVNYNLNYAGSASIDSKYCNLADSSCLVSQSDPSRDGYTFLGWSLTADSNSLLSASTDLLGIVKEPTTINLYAIWQVDSYSVIYNLDGGEFEGADLSNITYFVNLDNKNISMKVPMKEGYDFIEWEATNASVTNNTTATMINDGPVILNAKWSPKTLNVTFEGEGAISSSDCNFIECVIGNDKPTKNDYEFKYWLYEGVNGDYIFKPGDEIKGLYGNITLVPVFNDQDTYSIRYDTNLGTFEHTPINEFVKGVGANLPVPKKDGFAFAGWIVLDEDEEETEEVIYNVVSSRNSDISLKAKWTVNSLNVKTVSYLGTTISQVDFGSTFTFPAAPTAPDIYHVFAGWRAAVEDGSLYETGASVIINSDNTYVAEWEINTQFSIGYDLAGGAYGEDYPFNYNLDDSDIIISNPTRDGYRFAGWIEKNGNATVDDTGKLSVTNNGNLEFIATWTQEKFNITYDYASGNANSNPSTYNINHISDIVITSPSREHYVFNGWTSNNENISIDSEGKLVVTGDVYGDVKFTAQWLAKEYTVTFANTGLDADPTLVCTYDVECLINIVPTKDDRDFKYWESSVGTIYPQNGKIYALDDMTLTAVWDSTYTYNINYELNGGTFTVDDVVRQYHHGEDTNLPINDYVSKYGYTFTKWSTDATCEDEVTSITGGTSDLTFYACYSVNTYDVNYYTDETFTEVYDSNVGIYPYGYSHIVSNYLSEELNQVFIYWMGDDDRVYLPDSTIVVDKDLKLYPVFYTIIPEEPTPTHSISYDLRDGNDLLGGTLVGRYTEGDDFELGSVTRDGYEFLGWFDEEDNLVTSVEGKTTDLKLHADWRANKYTIKFFDGSTLLGSIPYEYDASSEAGLILEVLRKNGTYFVEGWSKSFDVSSIDYAATYDFTHLVTSKNEINLYAYVDSAAKYVIVEADTIYLNQYDVQYDSDSSVLGYFKLGTVLSDILTDGVYYFDSNFEVGASLEEVLNIDNEYLVENEDFTYPQADYSLTLYLKNVSIENDYELSFKVDGVSYDSPLACPYEEECDISTVDNPTKEGYVFLGWEDSEGQLYNDTFTNVENVRSVTLNALFAKESYSINFHDGDNLITSVNMEYGEFNDYGSVMEIQRNDDYYIVEGWSLNPSATTIDFDRNYDFNHFVVSSDTVNLYAVVDLDAEYIEIHENYTLLNQNNVGIKFGSASLGYYKLNTPVSEISLRDSLEYYFDSDYEHVINGTELLNGSSFTIENSLNEIYPQVRKYVTVYALEHTVVTEYEVGFYVDDEYLDEEAITCSYSDDYCDLSLVEEPTKEGYLFLGWEPYDEDTPEFADHLAYTDVNNIYLSYKALFAKESYTIKFHDGDNLITSVNMEYGEDNSYPLLLEVSRDGSNYVIEGWATASDATSPKYGINYNFNEFVTSDEEVNLYAVIDEDAEYIAVNRNYSQVNQNNVYISGGSGLIGYFKVNTPVSELGLLPDIEYYFDSSYEEPIVGTEFLNSNKFYLETSSLGNHPQVVSETTIYAIHRIELTEYSVGFYVDDEYLNDSIVTCSYGDDYCDLSLVEEPIKEGYTFVGWEPYNTDTPEFAEHLIYTNVNNWVLTYKAVFSE